MDLVTFIFLFLIELCILGLIASIAIFTTDFEGAFGDRDIELHARLNTILRNREQLFEKWNNTPSSDYEYKYNRLYYEIIKAYAESEEEVKQIYSELELDYTEPASLSRILSILSEE